MKPLVDCVFFRGWKWELYVRKPANLKQTKFHLVPTQAAAPIQNCCRGYATLLAPQTPRNQEAIALKSREKKHPTGMGDNVVFKVGWFIYITTFFHPQKGKQWFRTRCWCFSFRGPPPSIYLELGLMIWWDFCQTNQKPTNGNPNLDVECLIQTYMFSISTAAWTKAPKDGVRNTCIHAKKPW